MKPLLIAVLTSCLFIAAAEAQTATPAPAESPAVTSPTAPATPAATPSGKDVRAQCRSEAQAQGLKGPDRKAYVADCFAKARPDLAAAQKCRAEGKEKGLAGPDLRAYVKTCKAGAQ